MPLGAECLALTFAVQVAVEHKVVLAPAGPPVRCIVRAALS